MTTTTPPLLDMNWYLVHTKPRQEALALAQLTRQGYECYLPMIKVEKIRQRKTMLVVEPMFARYIFIWLDASGRGQSWTPIRSTLGVHQLVRFGAQAAKVDAHLVELIRAREKDNPLHPLFAQGEQVVVTEGPFSGLEAVYQTVDAQSRSMILLHILNKSVALHIDTASLRKSERLA